MRSVLIVDDLVEARGLIEALVREIFPQCWLHQAAGVVEAVRVIREISIDLALVDLSLADGAGTDVLHLIKLWQPRCLAIVATIHDADSHLFNALQAGADGYLLKDQPREVLRQQLQRITEGEPPLSPAVARRLMRHFQTPAPGVEEVPLTPREREVLALLARGLTLLEIARAMSLSRHTIGDHVKNLYRKLNVSSRAEAALQARAIGLT